VSAALDLQHISRRCGATQALDDVSLRVDEGEILAIVGENGAGKSTLMNVAYGLYRPDAGTVGLFGQTVKLGSPRDALDRGVGMVHQHFMLVPNLTVAENVVLGREPVRAGQFDLGAAADAVARTAASLGFQLDPRARIDQLSVGQQQRVEIVKALFRGAKLLMLDEPTAVLTPQEVHELHDILRKLRASGTTVLLVSHKLREVLAIADRVAVLVRGRMVKVVKASETTEAQLAQAMLASPTGEARPEVTGAHWGEFSAAARRPSQKVGEVQLELKDAHALADSGVAALVGASLTLRAGEILGVAGVAGNGQSELAEVLTGLRALTRGSLTVAGQPVPADPARARALGVSHIPEDRQRRGLCLDLTVAENVALGRHRAPPFARGMRLDLAGRAEVARKLIADFDVRPTDPGTLTRSLSGGNQQKIILGRELSGSPRVVVAVQPTRGLDVGAIANIHSHLWAARDAGAAVLLLSLDLDEIRVLSDRIAVMYGGRVVATVAGDAADEAQLGRWMLGQDLGG
jgi:simple sugar transport system ATP-binding protein